MKNHRNWTVANETVEMDEAGFFDCSLTNCKLLYNGGAIIWKDSVTLNCQWVFGGSALNTIEL